MTQILIIFLLATLSSNVKHNDKGDFVMEKPANIIRAMVGSESAICD